MSRKKIIIFDLDGTLTKSKSNLDQEMASLIRKLLRLRYVAVTSGCSFQQFENQFLSGLPKSTSLWNLFLFPTCSASGYYYDRKHDCFSQAYKNLLPYGTSRKYSGHSKEFSWKSDTPTQQRHMDQFSRTGEANSPSPPWARRLRCVSNKNGIPISKSV